LKKALYQLKQARQYKKLYKVLTKFGFVYVFSSNCLYIIREGERSVLLVLIYVNNMAIADLEGSKIISFKIHIFIWLSSASNKKLYSLHRF